MSIYGTFPLLAFAPFKLPCLPFLPSTFLIGPKWENHHIFVVFEFGGTGNFAIQNCDEFIKDNKSADNDDAQRGHRGHIHSIHSFILPFILGSWSSIQNLLGEKTARVDQSTNIASRYSVIHSFSHWFSSCEYTCIYVVWFCSFSIASFLECKNAEIARHDCEDEVSQFYFSIQTLLNCRLKPKLWQLITEILSV